MYNAVRSSGFVREGRCFFVESKCLYSIDFASKVTFNNI